ncbi:hypothetical protein CONCODRAFT_15659 [Conidiobolus coronatus NRRL 28638]|uniref:GATA-type domain-containing protein n=1 Tax=Conidiobolus coronatus (strain ATCC 28846 / CBS 209.66 / NRRL 28638) TaxID=796925 RepID=A0A137PE05_CONC2|nr:hypothetical protein CONCODRAFT_15659 [Conidiobolus coronatus NRRL 28638]|eukprot:KXN73171.1 hypothetical protein CONCODRAFT_15659 [Conidiobolus coronatus NRRL 28638]
MTLNTFSVPSSIFRFPPRPFINEKPFLFTSLSTKVSGVKTAHKKNIFQIHQFYAQVSQVFVFHLKDPEKEASYNLDRTVYRTSKMKCTKCRMIGATGTPSIVLNMRQCRIRNKAMRSITIVITAKAACQACIEENFFSGFYLCILDELPNIHCSYCWSTTSTIWRRGYMGVLLCSTCFMNTSIDKKLATSSNNNEFIEVKQDPEEVIIDVVNDLPWPPVQQDKFGYRGDHEHYIHQPYHTRKLPQLNCLKNDSSQISEKSIVANKAIHLETYGPTILQGEY